VVRTTTKGELIEGLSGRLGIRKVVLVSSTMQLLIDTTHLVTRLELAVILV